MMHDQTKIKSINIVHTLIFAWEIKNSCNKLGKKSKYYLYMIEMFCIFAIMYYVSSFTWTYWPLFSWRVF